MTREQIGGRVDRTWWSWTGRLVGVAILAVLVARLGIEPFVHAVRSVGAWPLAAAAAITVVTTVCCAWRWSLVAGGLGIGLPLPAAVAACYRSQLLNTALPGGVIGDVDRAVRHGRRAGDVGRGVRAVVWERSAGQAVQGVLALTALLLLPSPVRSFVPVAVTGVVVVALVAVVVSRVLRPRRSVWGGVVRTAVADLRDGVLARRALPGIVLASSLVVVGHTITFLVAARTAGATVPIAQLLPLALLVLIASGLPLNIAGWGPREGVAAWAFSTAGLGAAQGAATAVVYGVMVVVAGLPGAVVLITAWVRRSAEPGQPSPDSLPEAASG